MRELKFRVWEKSSKQFLVQQENWGIDEFPYNSISNPLAGYFLDNLLNNEHFVVQQFIGLKDKNAQEIYEGDIIEFTNSEWGEDETFKSQVFFIGSSFNVWADGNIGGDCLASLDDGNWEINNIKIIGNIFENPELIKKN